MKLIKLAVAVGAFAVAACSARAVSLSPTGPMNCKLTEIVQTQGFTLSSSKTNITSTSTNLTFVSKATIGKTNFNNGDLLALIANSFDTNFPAGSQVGLRFNQVFIVDSTGTNIIFNPGAVVSIQLEEDFNAGVQTETETLNKNGVSFSGNSTTSTTGSAILIYNDTAETTGDGTHTSFQFKGLFTVMSTTNFKTDVEKENIEFQGTGGGPIRGVPAVLTGTITVKAVGGLPPS